MIAASVPIQRPSDARLLVIDGQGTIRDWPRSRFVDLLRAGDVVIANDAATLPASLFGAHMASARPIEVRLAASNSLAIDAAGTFSAVVFGDGDYRMRTEDRPKPPALQSGDRLALGPLRAVVVRVLNHPRLVMIRFEGSPAEIWEGLARHGRPIQYAHVPAPLALWDIWTPIAGPPVAFEAPSAGFVLDWSSLASMTRRGIRFGTITHAAGISSTGDPELDMLLPFDEPYRIPHSTARMIAEAKGRVIAIGTTVVRALEHAGRLDGVVHAGDGVATQKIGASTRLRVVDVLLSGTHEPGTSHFELLGAFADATTLRKMDKELNRLEYRGHEFGDSVWVEKRESCCSELSAAA